MECWMRFSAAACLRCSVAASKRTRWSLRPIPNFRSIRLFRSQTRAFVQCRQVFNSGIMIEPGVFLHPHALVDPDVTIGAGTRVWAFAHIVSGAVVGKECNICDHTFIEGGVKIGSHVTLKCGVF